jgi:hypothetical protein
VSFGDASLPEDDEPSEALTRRMMMALTSNGFTLQTATRSGAAIRAQGVVANFLNGSADLAVIASLATAEPVNTLAARLAETEDAEMAEELMTEVVHRMKEGGRPGKRE